jgi:HSP20 family protein
MRILRYSNPAPRSLAPVLSYSARSPWSGLESELDRFFDSTLSPLAETMQPSRFPLDLYEDKENTYVRAELPGLKKEDIGIEFVDGFLSIQANRKEKNGDEEQSFALNRSVMIQDDVQTDKVTASYENGVLTVTLPKKEESKPKKISVSVN